MHVPSVARLGDILPLADAVRHWGFRYRAHNSDAGGRRRRAGGVRPDESSPPLPLVISPVATGR